MARVQGPAIPRALPFWTRPTDISREPGERRGQAVAVDESTSTVQSLVTVRQEGVLFGLIFVSPKVGGPPSSLARQPTWPHRAHAALRAWHTEQTPERATVDAMRQALTNVAGDFGSLCGAGLEPLRPSMRAYRNGTDAEVCPRTTRKKTTSGKRRGKERVKKGKRKGKERERTTSGKRRGKDNERVGLSATVLFSLLLNAASLN